MQNPGLPWRRWLNERLPQNQVDQAYDVLFKLYQVVHSEPMIAYYRKGSGA